jgi:hypothetical protein
MSSYEVKDYDEDSLARSLPPHPASANLTSDEEGAESTDQPIDFKQALKDAKSSKRKSVN